MIYSNYEEGMDMSKLKRLKSISSYNNNFYEGLSSEYSADLLFASSDDDNSTEWFIVKHEQFFYLGLSHTSEGEILHRYTERFT